MGCGRTTPYTSSRTHLDAQRKRIVVTLATEVEEVTTQGEPYARGTRRSLPGCKPGPKASSLGAASSATGHPSFGVGGPPGNASSSRRQVARRLNARSRPPELEHRGRLTPIVTHYKMLSLYRLCHHLVCSYPLLPPMIKQENREQLFAGEQQ